MIPVETRVLTLQNKSPQTKIGVRKAKDSFEAEARVGLHFLGLVFVRRMYPCLSVNRHNLLLFVFLFFYLRYLFLLNYWIPGLED